MPSHARDTTRRMRRAGALAGAMLGATAVWGAPAQADPPTIAVAGDSILITNQAYGPSTVQATRPDAITGKPVVIGQYSGSASSMGPFSVNTTTPTPLMPDGDCWQKGALPSAVTPDLQPGDRVTLTQEGSLGSPSTSTSVAVTAEAVSRAVGPIPACVDVAPFARNALTTAPDSVAGGPLALAGVAQPFATGVSVSASDGTVSSAPVGVGPAQDGTWSATIPADQVNRLAGGPLTVSPIFTVPDVSTGAMAHIAGPAVQVSKLRAGANGTAKPGSGGGGGSSEGAGSMRVASLRTPARIRLARARHKGIGVSFVVPAGAQVARVQLKRGGKRLMRRDVPAGKAGARQTVRLRGAALRRVLRTGRYRVAVRVGPRLDQLGPAVSGAIAVR